MKKKVALLLTIVLMVTMFIPVGIAETAQPYAGQTSNRISRSLKKPLAYVLCWKNTKLTK